MNKNIRLDCKFGLSANGLSSAENDELLRHVFCQEADISIVLVDLYICSEYVLILSFYIFCLFIHTL